MTQPHVVAVARSASHSFSKPAAEMIGLVAGLGVEGDAHLGETVQHLASFCVDPARPNLRQIHLIHSELFAELSSAGFELRPGEIGENITTRGLDLIALPKGTRLRLGGAAIVEIAGLRNPCRQLDAHRPGLTAACFGRDAQGALVRKAGIMGIVLAGGEVRFGDEIEVDLPVKPHERLVVV